MGANTSWEVIWTLIAAGCCIIAIIVGSRHELDAYRRMKQGKNVDEGPLIFTDITKQGAADLAGYNCGILRPG